MDKGILRIEKNSKIVRNNKISKNKKYMNIIWQITLAFIAFIFVFVCVIFINIVNTDYLSADSPPEVNIIEENKTPNGILTDLPKIVEKSVFEGLLTDILNVNILRKMKSYYTTGYLDRGIYVLDPNLCEREKVEILSYWNEYIGWSDKEYHKMLLDYKMLDSKYLINLEK